MGAVAPVASILPVISGVKTAMQLFNGELGIFNDLTGRNARQARTQEAQKNNLELQQLAQMTALQKQENAAAAALEEEKKRQALRHAVARKRAEFGSRGIGGTGGSTEAVLLGMFEESEAEKARRQEIESAKASIQDAQLQQKQATNLLLATQLAERQKLQRFYLS